MDQGDRSPENAPDQNREKPKKKRKSHAEEMSTENGQLKWVWSRIFAIFFIAEVAMFGYNNLNLFGGNPHAWEDRTPLQKALYNGWVQVLDRHRPSFREWMDTQDEKKPDTEKEKPRTATESGQKTTTESRRNVTTESRSNTRDTDPYDVNEYSNPDDFADEWQGEFYDEYDDDDEAYDEAYEYWEDHHKGGSDSENSDFYDEEEEEGR